MKRIVILCIAGIVGLRLYSQDTTSAAIMANELETMTWYVDDSCFTVRMALYSGDSYVVTRYTKERGTHYAYVENKGKSYQVIPIAMHDETKHSSLDEIGSAISVKLGKRFSVRVGDSTTLMLIPIFDDNRMPGDFVRPVLLDGDLIYVSRIISPNVYWGIEYNRNKHPSKKRGR